MGFMSGKRILITGLASKLSIAHGIAQAMHQQGAELAFSYQGDKLKSRVEEMANSFGSSIVLPCDVASDESITALFAELAKVWPKFDGLFIQSPMHQPINLTVIMLMRLPAKDPALPTILVHIALLR